MAAVLVVVAVAVASDYCLPVPLEYPIKLHSNMSKVSTSTIVLTTVGILVLCLLLGGFSSYNGLVSKEEDVAEKWANVQTQYQRRADLVPNLVSTVKGYAKHEQETLESVVAARAKATQLTIDADNLTPENLRRLQAAQGELSTALGKLLAIQEQYPQLRANENFSELQAQLEGTENRIGESRRRYNESVRVYNTSVRRFPTNIVAGIFGFEKKAPFEADQAAASAPKVSF